MVIPSPSCWRDWRSARRAAAVVVVALPEMFRFLIVLFVVGSAMPTVWPQMTALLVLVLLLVSVMSRLAPPELEPSTVT